MRSTKKSLIMSTISLILCFAMLLGSTYAWFTDEVTSGVNQIKAGNLDVELWHTSKSVTTAKEIKNNDANLLFNDVTLWEPGAYAYETFTVKNVGNLALKYKMALNVAAFTSYNGHDLTEVLKVTTMDTAPTSRADITDGTALKDWSLNSDNVALYPVGSSLGTLSEKTFTVAIYWEPTDHDNDFNMNNGRPQPLSVDLGVKLVATQLQSESDSFGTDYDAQADNELVPAERVESAMAKAVVKSGEETVFKATAAPSSEQKQTEVIFEAGALEEGEYQLEVNTENNLFTATSENGLAATIDLKLFDGAGTLAETFKDGKTATITTYITKGLQGTVTVIYTGTDDKAQPTNVTYEAETGKLTFKTNHFSEYTVSSDSVCYSKLNDTAYTTLADAVNAAKEKDVITVLKNVDANITVAAGKDFILNLNGFTINGKKVNQSPAVTNKGTLVITDTSKSGTGKIMREDKNGDAEPYYVIDNQGVMTIEKANVYNEASNGSGGATLIRSGVGTSPVLTINDGTFTNVNYAVVKNEKGDLTVNGGTFDSGTQYTAIQIYGNAVLNGGSFSKGITKSAGTLVTNGGNFKYNPSNVGANSFMIVNKSKSFDESYQYQVRLNGNEPTEYDAKVVKNTGAVIYCIGKTPVEGANEAMSQTYSGYTVYFYAAPTTTKEVTATAIYNAWFADGVTPAGFVAKTGFELVETKDSSTGIIEYKGVVSENSAVASITNESGTHYYADVRDAVNAAQDNETVKLLKDYAYSGQPMNACSNFNVENGRVTIDLNGHTLSNVTFVSTKNGKNQTITVIDSGGTGVSEGYINNYIDNSNLVIKGGTYSNYVFAQKGTITIEGGTFHGDLAEKAYVGNGINLPNPEGKSGELVIKGGTFSSNPSAYVADGYQAIDNSNGTWTVQVEAN